MATNETTIESKPEPQMKRRGRFAEIIWRLWHEKPLGVVGLVIVLLLFFTGIFAPWLAPEKGTADSPGYNIIHLMDRFGPPGPEYPLGADQLGRDVLSRIIYGARLSMIVAVVGTLINTVVSTALGMACAYFGGWFDIIVQRFVDAWVCFPGLVLLITLMSIVGPGLTQLLLILGISGGIYSTRFKRSLVFAIRENQYVYASESLGATSGRVMLRHLLPNIMPMIIVIYSMNMGGTILYEASLSFLGLGLPPPNPSWGGMISGEGRANMLLAPWIMFWPGLVLSLVVFGINMLGDALRDLLDPRLRGGVGGLGAFGSEKARKAREKKKVGEAKSTG